MKSALAFVTLTVATLTQATNIETVQSDIRSLDLSLGDSNSQNSEFCNITVAKRSVDFFRTQIESVRPNFIHFNIYFKSYRTVNATAQTFKPNKWVWTYRSPSGLYPYLFWNIDYNVLSFGLLDAKTLRKKDMYILLEAPSECVLTFGTPETTQAIAEALKTMIASIVNTSAAYTEYEESYFCYLAEAPVSHQSLEYQAAVYLMYPISYINYNCCRTIHNYTLDKFTVMCFENQIEKWVQCILWPYILGIIIFLFFPIWMFQIASWISKDEVIVPSDYEMMVPGYDTRDSDSKDEDCSQDDWIYLDGETPYKFTDLLTHIWCGLNKTWPTAISRIRRLVVILLMPIGVYVQIIVYNLTMLDDTKLLIEHGTPMGFLSLLGDKQHRKKTFATVFGGPEVMLIFYYTIGTLFLVVPRSFKQIVEDGMPTQSVRFKSPLLLSVKEVKQLSMVKSSLEPGYEKGVTLLKCGIYMVFSEQFWKFAFKTQVERVYDSSQKTSSSRCFFFLKLLALPFYIVLCLFEIVLCIFIYSFPLCMFTLIIIRGATRSLGGFRAFLMQYFHSSILRKLILDNPVLRILVFLCIAILILLYAYAVCLVFIESFAFISQIIVFCFVAVIVYPSVSFGYLFFFVVLIYYIVRRVRDFGDGYLELLSEAVEISRNLDGQPNYVTFFGSTMMIANVKTPSGVKAIQINSTTIDVAQNVLQSILNDPSARPKIKNVDNVYGIPRDLFTFLVRKHRPAHQQVLKIAFNIALIVVLIAVTMSISSKYVSGPSSEISEVMHVIFIVAVGALPRVLEVAMMNASASVKKEIELRHLEQSVVEFWEEEDITI